MPYCPECGAEIKSGVKFCPECGTRIARAATPKSGERRKRPVLVPSPKIPPPKVMPGGKRPHRPYRAEKPEGVPPKHEIPASEIPKDQGELLHPSSAIIKYGKKTPEERAKELRRQNRIGAAIAIPIVIIVIVAVPYFVLGYPIWEIFEDGGGGGGGGPQTWQIVSEYGDTATLTVDSSGNFTGSGWVGSAPGLPDYNIYITNGRMSGTSMTFEMTSSYSGGQLNGTGYGELNASFPGATSAFGSSEGIISDPLGTRDFYFQWDAWRI